MSRPAGGHNSVETHKVTLLSSHAGRSGVSGGSNTLVSHIPLGRGNAMLSYPPDTTQP